MGRCYIVAIDPDIDKNGVAFIEKSRREVELDSLTFPETLERVKSIYRGYKEYTEIGGMATFKVYVEAGWLNKGNWHIDEVRGRKMSPQAWAAAVGKKDGQCAAVSQKLIECFEYYGIPVTPIRPLRKCWKGKDRKITHEELAREMALYRVAFPYKRTNQETRDAALIALVNL